MSLEMEHRKTQQNLAFLLWENITENLVKSIADMRRSAGGHEMVISSAMGCRQHYLENAITIIPVLY